MKIFRLFIALTLICFALSQRAQGVVPPPPGGYPNFTTAAGDHALQALTLGLGNTALGTFSMFSVTTGNFNTAVGAGALDLNTADSNTATGAAALLLNTTGTENTANGTAALEFNDSGSFNTAVGTFALFNSTASRNTAIGREALFNNTTGDENTAVGTSGFGGGPALFSNTTGRFNTAVGLNALLNATGSNNVALGSNAGNQADGSGNVYIGYNIGGSSGESNTCYIKSIFGQTNNLGSAVFIDANNKLGTLTSSKRFKEEIKPMDKVSEALFALKPVTFRYKKEIDPAGTPQLGLVAEEVEKVNPDLVVRDKEGKPYSVRYDQVNAMLLNEFLKEHRKNEEQEKTIAELKSGMTVLAATVKEQTAQIQKVGAQLEASKPAPQTVLNRQ